MHGLANRLGVLVLVAMASAVGTRDAAAVEPRLLYLNVSDGDFAIFGGPADDATENTSAVATVAPFPAFTWPASAGAPTVSREDARAYLLFALHKAFLPYNAVWTDVRPVAGPYTMVVVGGSPELLGFDRRVAGVALLDCDDVQPSNMVFAFPAAVPGDLHGLFITAAQETAHAFGLEHTEDEEDIMHAKLGPAQWTFTNRVNLVTPPRLCGRMAQNSHAALLAVLGAWPAGQPKPLADGTIPDIDPPVITINAPSPASFTGEGVAVTFSAEDPSGLSEVGLQSAVASRTWNKPTNGVPLTAQLALPPRAAEITVWARDIFGNQIAKSLVFDVPSSTEPGGCNVAAPLHRARRRPDALVTTLFVLFLTLRACRLARR
ncbi:MAG: hypothetical protein SF187_07900 [Deltaproteobacteria bacterium]|nr:hypothetical protein [Deltaproteobacteria bacterium]